MTDACLDMFSLEHRTALVTGSSRGLGFEIAKAMSLAGAKVWVNSRSAINAEAAVEQIASTGGVAESLVFDVNDPMAVRKASDTLSSANEPQDILVNNAAIRNRKEIFAYAITEIREVINTNLIAQLELSRVAATLIRNSGAGRIINVSSVVAAIGGANDAPYAASKAGLESMTRALAGELGCYGVTVNAIAPGFFATDANEKSIASDVVAEWLAGRSALGRWAQPEEISGAALFLASNAGSYITGHTLVVDGGLSSQL